MDGLKWCNRFKQESVPGWLFQIFSDLDDIACFGSVRIARFSHLYNNGLTMHFFRNYKNIKVAIENWSFTTR